MIPYRGKVTLDKTISYISSNTNYAYIDNLSKYDFSELMLKLDETTLSEIILNLVSHNLDVQNLQETLVFCNALNLDVLNTENKNILMDLLNLYMDNRSLFPEDKSIYKLFCCFNDKKIGIEYLRYVFTHKTIQGFSVLESLIDYLVDARQYYVDDRALITSAISLLESFDDEVLTFGHKEIIEKTIEKKLTDDKKINGVYDIDQFTLEEIDRKMNQFELLSSRLQTIVEITDQQIEELKNTSKTAQADINDVRLETLKTLKVEANKILKEFNSGYLELLTKEKETLISHKDELLADIDMEIQKKKMELEVLAANVAQRIAIELGRIRNLSDHSIEKIQDFINNNEEVKKMVNSASIDQEVLNNIVKINSTQLPQGSIATPIAVPASTALSMPNIFVPKTERVVNEKINYYFDKKIPFKDRFDELMYKKNEDIQKNGAIYHEKFDDLLTMVLMNEAPYMYGPSGCGKTFMIERQLAKLLGIDVVTNGYIMYETDILGFNNANGVYVPTNFYRCYKYGDIVFLDELDNSQSSSTIVLNSFIGKGENYTFPGGDTIKRHPNFRIISAGNTRGNGRTVSHNTRKKLDEAVMQRLTPIEIDYDNRIEEKILENYPDWYNFAINFRNALKGIRIGDSDGPNYSGTITTRDIETIRQYKDDNSFSDEKIIEYQVIENKEVDYLTEILKEMERLEQNGHFTEGGSALLEKLKKLSKGRKY